MYAIINMKRVLMSFERAGMGPITISYSTACPDVIGTYAGCHIIFRLISSRDTCSLCIYCDRSR